MAAVLAATLGLNPVAAGAAPPNDCRPDQTLRLRGGTLRLENDLFAGTDRNYTNGVALSLISHDIVGRLRTECLPRPVALYARALRGLERSFWQRSGLESTSQNVVVRLGQSMYTPQDRERRDLIVDDRPYAGLLYFGLAWNRRSHPTDARYERLDSRELTLGVIGPASLARQSQNLVHDVRGIDRFQGWHNQLRNEPALQWTRERKFKPYADGAVLPGWGSDAIGGYALRLGNVETSLSAGLELRAGWNIPNDFGSYPIRPGGENRPPSALGGDVTTARPSGSALRPGVHVFASLQAKAVAHDFSLDGNLFRSSHSVNRRPWVAQAAVGISGQWRVSGHGMRLALMRVWRSREFAEQQGTHSFGSIAVSMDF